LLSISYIIYYNHYYIIISGSVTNLKDAGADHIAEVLKRVNKKPLSTL